MPSLQHGLPVRAALHPAGLYLLLSPIAPADLQDGFMHQTVSRLRAPETLLHVPRHELGRWDEAAAPAGVIFHVGRCGSTLVSQQLKQLPGVTVYSEPLPCNELLMPPLNRPRAETIAALRSLAMAFHRHAGGPYVVKLSSWCTLFCDLIAEAFPATPWVFNHRDPLEVAVPLVRETPPWLRPGEPTAPAFRAMIDPQGASTSEAELVARLYGRFCDAVGRLDLGRGRPLAYADLPVAAWTEVAPHFGLPVDDAAREAMASSAGLYAKAPAGGAGGFTPDGASKAAAASGELRAAVDRYARPPLERLLATFAQRTLT